MEWLADRFFLEKGTWIDAATGSAVRVHVEDASPLDALDWDEQCSRLLNARHPLLNPLVDYGAAGAGRRFEAYAAGPEVLAHGAAAERLMVHLTDFLRTSGISLPVGRSRLAVRPVGARRFAEGRPIGVTLQPRRALAAIRETLESPAVAPVIITLVAPSASGLRTARLLIARHARVLGFVPVCSAVLTQHGIRGILEQRHLCVLDDEGSARRDVAAALVRLTAASARRHVLVRFRRVRGERGAIVLEPLPIRALLGMVFTGSEGAPSEEELFEAARLSDGRPGAYIAHLTGRAPGSASVVHETSPEYVVTPAAAAIGSAAAAPPVTRRARTAADIIVRADGLASRARHAAASRVLRRGARVLAGRGLREQAAECLVRDGTLALDRGRTQDAAAAFLDAQRLSPSGGAALRAAAGIGEAWTDDLRLVEAEAVLRGAISAAETASDPAAALIAMAGLVRCLCQQERPGDAIGAAATLDWSDDDRTASIQLLAALSRGHAALGRTATALRLARRAQVLAGEAGHAAATLTAHLALAEALGAAGDTPGMIEALAKVRDGARAARLPLLRIRAELTAFEHGNVPLGHAERARALRRLHALDRSALPRLLRERITAAAKALDRRPPEPPPPDIHREAADALEMLLQACQQAPDDGGALSAVCGAVLRRVQAATVMVMAAGDRRLLACEGRPWVAHSSVVGQALAAGRPCASDAGTEPREAAEPVRFGGEILGAVACRWTAGAVVDGLGAAAVLHAAALAVAAHVRAVLDRAVPAAPAAAWGDLLGDSPAAAALRDAVSRAAKAPFPVLIEGESGCGKELVARAIHRLSPRRDRRFCAINCAALTDELVEAELFGHTRGAFTGAAGERAGLFEEADGGTLFLDEVSELSARAQAKLLRVLQEGEVRRVGENFPRRVDARIVAATNRQLEAEVAAGRFRADLRFRLDVVRITVPPLRDRPGDIALLAMHFWNGASKSVGSQATLTGDTLAALARYDWPGNVRELQNVIAWIAVHSPRRGRIGPSALPAHVAQSAVPVSRNFEAAREEFERRFIRAALASANGRRAEAAESLGITRQGLAKIMKRLRIDDAR